MFSASGVLTGFDLGTRAVKLVRARGTKVPEKLISAGVEPIDAGNSDSWSEGAGRALSRLLEREGLKPRDAGRVLAALSGPAVHLRQVDLPSLADTEFRASLKYEARKHLPIDPSVEAALDSQVLIRKQNGDGMSVLLVGAPESFVASRVKVLTRSGLEPEVVDAAPLSLLNGLYALPDWRGNTATIAVLDLGGTSTTITFNRPGGVVYSRNLPIGAQGGLSEAYVGAVVGAYHETAQFYASLNERRPVDNVFLTGGGALFPGVEARLSAHLNLNVAPLDLGGCLDYSPTGKEAYSLEEFQRLAPQFAVALGLLHWGSGGNGGNGGSNHV